MPFPYMEKKKKIEVHASKRGEFKPSRRCRELGSSQQFGAQYHCRAIKGHLREEIHNKPAEKKKTEVLHRKKKENLESNSASRVSADGNL